MQLQLVFDGIVDRAALLCVAPAACLLLMAGKWLCLVSFHQAP